jgi:putative ABC transport system substrate-binding protein
MAENGLAEGRNYVLDARWAEGDYTRFAALAADLAQRKPKVILVTTIPAGRIAQQLAPTVPLVMVGLIDPVGAGLIASLARPGNNTTGVSNMAQDMTAKGLELLRTVVPTIKTVAVLFNPANPGNHLILEDVRNKAATLSVMVRPVEFKGPDALDTTIEVATGNDASLMIGDAALIDLRERVAALALQHRLPTVSTVPEFTDAGALIGYGPSRRALYKRAATYVKKVLDGAKPSDLPVEQPTEIELSINVRTAKALGLVFPDTLIARADRVIE